MNIFKKSKEIMGINARNLLYVSRYNSRANKKFADDKIFTKHYLQSRGIDVARLYQVIRSHNELNNFKPEMLPSSFVIKPNKGYGGQGIIVIGGKEKNKYIGLSGKKYSWQFLYQHCESILGGKYSISGMSDQVIFEELLVCHEYLKDLGGMGLPDIRIIVFNLVPVMAMLRLPTEESRGKANLHLGAIGLGIDMKSGKTTYGVRQKNIYNNEFIKQLPNGDKISSVIIPEWDKILFMAAKAQQVSQIGYLAVDLVSTITGVKILELNARAGLAVQIANLAPLRTRLNKIADLKVITPEQGVEISKTLFTKSGKKSESINSASQKPIIGPHEEVEILNTKYKSVWAKIDPHATHNTISDKIDINKDLKLLKIKIADKRLVIPVTIGKFKSDDHQLVLSGKYLADFLIDTSLIKDKKKSNNLINDKDKKIIQNVDNRVCRIDEIIHLLSYLRPLNLKEEKEIFFEHQHYDPKFIYRNITIDIKQLKKDLEKIPTHFNHPMTSLYINKIKEINYKLSILDSINTPKLQYYSEKLYGKVDNRLYDKAVDYIKKHPINKDTSKKLSFSNSVRRIEKFLNQNKLNRWKIKIADNVNSDMQVNKSGIIFIKKGASFTTNRLESLIAHEIQTHIFRGENGRLQKYKILERGTADYLVTEEGLAIYNQDILGLNVGDKQIWPALNAVAVFKGKEMGFSDLYHYMMETYFINEELAWKICVKVKRGYNDTSQKLVFTKDHIYFSGNMMIEKFVNDNGKDKLRDLYIGKIGIKSLKYLGDLKKYPVKYLPENYNKS